MDNDLFLYNKRKEYTKFKVVGLVPSPQFQKCCFLTKKMHTSFPETYQEPEIRPMLNLDWDEYLTKMRRRHGKPYYLLQVPAAVYVDGKFLGGDEALDEYIAKICNLETNIDFQEMAHNELISYFLNIVNKYERKFIYLTVAIDERIIGSMLFMLYNDLVPNTCKNFLSRCVNKDNGYKGTNIHRIARYSFVQCGGFNVNHIHMACENYAVPHNRRGVLSMSNLRRHEENSTQFFITLEPADWMDYNYVAFGQLIQGAEVLNLIENVSTYYQNPLRKIKIVNCGEFTLCPEPDETYKKALNPPYETLFNDEEPIVKVDSVLSISAYLGGKYFLKTDIKSYLPLNRYSRMFDILKRDFAPEPEATPKEEIEQEMEEEAEPSPPKANFDLLKDELVHSHTFYFSGNHVII